MLTTLISSLPFFSRKTHIWDDQIKIIQREWGLKGGVVKVHKFLSDADMRKSLFPCSVKKNEFHLGIQRTTKDKDILYVTKHKTRYDIPLNCKFEDLTVKEMKELSLIPSDTICSSCYEVSSFLSYEGFCNDCK